MKNINLIFQDFNSPGYNSQFQRNPGPYTNEGYSNSMKRYGPNEDYSNSMKRFNDSNSMKRFNDSNEGYNNSLKRYDSGPMYRGGSNIPNAPPRNNARNSGTSADDGVLV